MIRVEFRRWHQSLEDLRLTSLNAAHPRTRERFQALYLVASGHFNASSCAAHIGRQDETVLSWIHLYNQRGPQALVYRHYGGRAPFLPKNRRNNSWTPWKSPSQPTTA
jgi:hypothetical protein